MLRLFSALFLGLALWSCHVSPNQSQLSIRAGEATKAYPAVGFLTINEEYGCTGTLIAPNVVLAAAHCVTEDEFPPFRLNEKITFAIDDTDIPVDHSVFHPGYMDTLNACLDGASESSQKLFQAAYICEGQEIGGEACEKSCSTCTANSACSSCLATSCKAAFEECKGDLDCQRMRDCQNRRTMDEFPNDLALLFLSQPVTRVKPLPLARHAKANELVTLVGFGPQGPELMDTIGTKSKGSNKLGEVYEHVFTYHGTKKGRANLMGGDSGGPTIVTRSRKTSVLGVHSHLSSFCDGRGELVGVDIRTEAYIDWIRSYVPDLMVVED